MTYPEMTFNSVIDELFKFAKYHKQINNYGFGNLVDFSRKNEKVDDVKYPLMFITPQNITYNKTTTQYDISIVFGDILQDGNENGKYVISNMGLIAKDLISYITNPPSNPNSVDLTDVFDITFPVNGIPFQERFNDFIGGVSLDLTIIVRDSINTCSDMVVIE
jgi:hypothetical protein